LVQSQSFSQSVHSGALVNNYTALVSPFHFKTSFPRCSFFSSLGQSNKSRLTISDNVSDSLISTFVNFSSDFQTSDTFHHISIAIIPLHFVISFHPLIAADDLTRLIDRGLRNALNFPQLCSYQTSTVNSCTTTNFRRRHAGHTLKLCWIRSGWILGYYLVRYQSIASIRFASELSQSAYVVVEFNEVHFCCYPSWRSS
jgi:hypothetical protein